MQAMERVTFVQGLFCGILVTIVGATAFGPDHHKTPAAGTGEHSPITTPSGEHAPAHAPADGHGTTPAAAGHGALSNIAAGPGVAALPTVPPVTTPAVTTPAVVTPVTAARQARTYDLTWTAYDGTGDPATAKYILDGQVLGTGEPGVAAVRDAVAKLPAGSTIRVRVYYPPTAVDGVTKKYPLDVDKLHKLADEHDLVLSMPKPPEPRLR